MHSEAVQVQVEEDRLGGPNHVLVIDFTVRPLR